MSLVPVLSMKRLPLAMLMAVAPLRLPPSLRVMPPKTPGCVCGWSPPISVTLPVVVLALTSVNVFVLAPARTRLTEPLMFPPKVLAAARFVVRMPLPVIVPPDPSTEPVLLSVPTYWLLAPKASVPPLLTTRSLLTARVLLPAPRVRVPWLMVVWPV